MLSQQVLAEIAVEIAPDRVYVIGVVLRVVVFDQKRRTLHPVVMRIAFIDTARPAEIYLVEAGLPHLLRPLLRHLLRHSRQVFTDQFFEQSLLLLIHLARRDAFWFERV